MQSNTRVAIVGIGGLFSKSPTLDHFWDNVVTGTDTSSEVPEGRWLLPPNLAYDPAVGRKDKVYSKRGYFIEDWTFDPTPCRLRREFLSQLDPLFHITLHVGHQAWNDCRTEQVDRDRCGVILGSICLPTDGASAFAEYFVGDSILEQLGADLVSSRNHPASENWHPSGLPAALLAESLGLRGHCFTLDAACASSLYAIKLARDKLLTGEADAMIAGGVSRPDCLYTQMGFSQLRALSPTGKCSPFDRTANGLVVGEGGAMFVLKRLRDAHKHGDKIYGVLAGIGLSNDTRGNVLAPDSEGQVRAMRSAYAKAAWRPSDVDYIECHATGTTLGDGIELQSLNTLWADEPFRQCPLGSVKANVGHTLTAAGAAGLLKVLLALQHDTLPPATNFQTPQSNLSENTSWTLLPEGRTWDRRRVNHPRRAAVSAFGFGGINAHLIVEEWIPERRDHLTPEPKPFRQSHVPLAIIGVAAVLDGKPDGNTFRVRGFHNESVTEIGPSLSEVRVSRRSFRIPPADLREMLPQQLLMLDVARKALKDAGWNGEDADRTGVFIGLGLDPNTTNFHLRWWFSRLLAEAQKATSDPSIQEVLTSLSDSLDGVHPALTAGKTLGALASITASRIAREFGFGGPSFTLSSAADSGNAALDTACQMLHNGDIQSAVVGAVDLPWDLRTTLARQLSETPETRRELPQEGALAIVLKRLTDAERDGDLIYAVIEKPRDSQGDSINSPGTSSPQCDGQGHLRRLSKLLQAALGLRERRTLGPAGDPRYWFQDAKTGPRSIVLGESQSGRRTRLVTQVSPSSPPVPSLPLREGLFVVRGHDRDTLVQHLEELRLFAEGHSNASIGQLARQWHWKHSRMPGELRCAFVVESHEELTLQIQQRIQSCQSSNNTTRHPTRPGLKDTSYCSLDHAFEVDKIAFVFPGSGNWYPGMGRDLFLHWPQSLDQQERENQWLRSQYQSEIFWDFSDFENVETRRLLMGQVAFGTGVTDLLSLFDVRPQAVIGYSLGETTALFATRIWRDRDGMLHRLLDSPLFHSDLCGEYRAARESWRLSPHQPVDWASGIVPCSADDVLEALHNLDRVYLLIKNSPKECVIGGQREAVEMFLRRLRVGCVPTSARSSVHCPIVRVVEDRYRDLHTLPVHWVHGVTLYSGATGTAYVPSSKSAADALTNQALGTLDFPRVIQRAYSEGVRTFVEVGPGNSCTRIIGQILEGRPHLAVAMTSPRESEPRTLLRCLAKLIAAGHEVNIDVLYGTAATDVPMALSRETEDTLSVPVYVTHPRGLPAVLTSVANLLAGQRRNIPKAILMETDTTPPEEPTHDPSAPSNRHLQPPASWAPAYASMLGQRGEAHRSFLAFSNRAQEIIEICALAPATSSPATARSSYPHSGAVAKTNMPVVLNRHQCLEFAVGKIGAVLGDAFAEADNFPTRVRLPDEPLMLVDRVLTLEGEPRSMTSGRVVTEHDVKTDGWYLDNNRIPSCIAIESGQADLFLSGYLGIDFQTRGLAVYRLLDAAVTFHGPLPEAGRIIRYDIHIDGFFRQGQTCLFRFRFEGTVDGEPLLTMTDGCAGFFTESELAAGKGIVAASQEARLRPEPKPLPWVPWTPARGETYASEQLDALLRGDLVGMFGKAFEGLSLRAPLTLPGGLLRVLDRIVHLDSQGGPGGLGVIRAEQDIEPDAWFLTCHFVDDQVMPGTLMYECCLHTLRVYLLRCGWVGDREVCHFEPVPGVRTRLKCRGQVTATSKVASYEVTLTEIGYNPHPYALADATMFADGKPIVQLIGLSVQLSGTTENELRALWNDVRRDTVKPALYTQEQILAFAIGKPSEAFGIRYKAFDEDRRIARLPGPPYAFLDRITGVTGEPWVMVAGPTAEAEYDVPVNGWYFAADRQTTMPFAVLLEVALQPCGWLAAYVGSALTSPIDLRFRNLGGTATQHREVISTSGTLTTKVSLTHVSNSGGMIIQHFTFSVLDAVGVVYEGTTYFGFFSDEALGQQVGIREEKPYSPSATEQRTGMAFPIPTQAPFSDKQMQMVDQIDLYVPQGGPNNQGLLVGSVLVNPEAWFFKAHFFQDPVWPGSLGLESFIQLLKVFVWKEAGVGIDTEFESPMIGEKHHWKYRGQVLPSDTRVTVQAEITEFRKADRLARANGWLSVDGRLIYQMKDFTLRWH